MQNILRFKIGELLDKPLGTSINYTLEGEIELDELVFKSDLYAKVELMKIEKAINVAVSDLEIKAQIPCDKCLKEFDFDVNIDFIERQFYFKAPKNEDTRNIYVADMKRTEVDISEMLRQEINLHFPPVAVCFSHCKGMCPQCGVNKNDQECSCVIETEKGLKQNPFAQLRNLLK